MHTAEIEMAINCGVSADSIIYAHPAKQLSNLRYAAQVNVRKIVVDGDFELYKIQKHFPNAQ